MGWEAVSHVWCDALYVLVGVVEWGLCASLYTSLCDQVLPLAPTWCYRQNLLYFKGGRNSGSFPANVCVCAKLLPVISKSV